jgi:hypothetical protein
LGGFDVKARGLGLDACLQDARVPVGPDFEQLFEGEIGRQGTEWGEQQQDKGHSVLTCEMGITS